MSQVLSTEDAVAGLAGPDDETFLFMRLMITSGHMRARRRDDGKVRYCPTPDGVAYALSLLRLAGLPEGIAISIMPLLKIVKP